MDLVSYSRRLTVLAEEDPDRPAITCGEHSLTRAELESAANRLARDLAAGGAGLGDMVTVALPNSDGVVRRRRGLLEDRRHSPAGVGPPARAGAAGHPRTGEPRRL